jgi:hypothetical protein
MVSEQWTNDVLANIALSTITAIIAMNLSATAKCGKTTCLTSNISET